MCTSVISQSGECLMQMGCQPQEKGSGWGNLRRYTCSVSQLSPGFVPLPPSHFIQLYNTVRPPHSLQVWSESQLVASTDLEVCSKREWNEIESSCWIPFTLVVLWAVWAVCLVGWPRPPPPVWCLWLFLCSLKLIDGISVEENPCYF